MKQSPSPPDPGPPAPRAALDADGNAQRFDALYDREHTNVLRFILRRLPNADLARAEDLASDVFLAAWRRIGDIRPGEATEHAWLYAVARNCLLNEQRASARRGALQIRLASDTCAVVPAPEYEVEQRLDLAAAWNSLTPGDQEVPALEIWEDLSSTEAGRVLGISATAYRFRLHRARKALRSALDPRPAYQSSVIFTFAME